jgi:hypothetical protein
MPAYLNRGGPFSPGTSVGYLDTCCARRAARWCRFTQSRPRWQAAGEAKSTPDDKAGAQFPFARAFPPTATPTGGRGGNFSRTTFLRYCSVHGHRARLWGRRQVGGHHLLDAVAASWGASFSPVVQVHRRLIRQGKVAAGESAGPIKDTRRKRTASCLRRWRWWQRASRPARTSTKGGLSTKRENFRVSQLRSRPSGRLAALPTGGRGEGGENKR